MQALRNRARAVRNRWIDQSLASVEGARARLVRGTADLLLLGDSSCISLAHGDTDRRLIPELIADATGSSVVPIAGPGYDARMFGEVLRVLGMVEQRPRAVVLSINIRTSTAFHVTHHPVYGHRRSREALARISPPLQRVVALGRGGMAWRQDEIAEFRRQQVTTRWGGTRTIGDHVTRLEGHGPPPWPVEVERGRFDYFHGEVVHEDNEGLQALAALGRRLAEYGVPAVAYWAQPPVAHGERLFPGEFAAHVTRNLGLVEGALLGGGAALRSVLKPELDDVDFQDHRNGTEHYSASGRVKVAEAVAGELERTRA